MANRWFSRRMQVKGRAAEVCRGLYISLVCDDVRAPCVPRQKTSTRSLLTSCQRGVHVWESTRDVRTTQCKHRKRRRGRKTTLQEAVTSSDRFPHNFFPTSVLPRSAVSLIWTRPSWWIVDNSHLHRATWIPACSDYEFIRHLQARGKD